MPETPGRSFSDLWRPPHPGGSSRPAATPAPMKNRSRMKNEMACGRKSGPFGPTRRGLRALFGALLCLLAASAHSPALARQHGRHRPGAPALAADSSRTLPRSTPERQGVSSSAILAFVEAADKEVDQMNSFMLVRHGRVVAE